MSEHTPTPWKAVDVSSTERSKRGIVYYQIKSANGAKSSIGFAGVYEGKDAKANANFIIEAVNNYEDQSATIAELVGVLQKIVNWEIPQTSGRFWDDGQPMSYSAAYGSNGERDYMCKVAEDALAKAAAK
jgi:hypothetical protein